MNLNISRRAIDLIIEMEQGSRYHSKPHWPGARSGITIGYGYDLGYVSVSTFKQNWGSRLPSSTIKALQATIGKKGTAAKPLLATVKHLNIPKATARNVFDRCTLPEYARRTQKAFPGVAKLPSNVQGALVSLVINRGTSMKGDRRTEMRAIRKAVQAQDLETIAAEIQKMIRLWQGKGLSGLVKRRILESLLVKSAIPGQEKSL